MKKAYLTLTLFTFALLLQAQTYEYSLSFQGTNPSTGNYQIALIATPDFDQSTPASTADIGAAVYLPSDCSIGNFEAGDVGIQPFEWSAIQEASYDGGTTDLIQLYRQEFIPNNITHSVSQPLTLVKFDVIPDSGVNPTSGEIIFGADYTDVPTGNTYESFMNVDLTGGNTQDYFSIFDPSANSVSFSTLSINEGPALTDLEISVYPNPTPDVIHLVTKNTGISYSIFNVLGQSVKSNGFIGANSNQSINLNNLPDGIYILKVQDEQNLSKKSFKIIKKK